MSEVVKMPERESANAITPMEMLDKALSNGASPESLEKLMDLQERWEASVSRKAFVNDMALARAQFEPILKRESGYNNRYKYETLNDVVDAVRPALSEHGFSFDWVTEDLPENRIRVTCVITHKGGFERRNSLSGDPKETADEKANMNAFQRLGGAVTYLQRITLKAALGVAAEKDTDAGGGVSKKGMTVSEEAAPLMELIDKTPKEKLAALQPTIKSRGKPLSNPAYSMVIAHYNARVKREKELANA